MLQIISQIALCLLLILTTIWCVIVHRKLSHLRHDEGPLRELVQALNEATAHADQTITEMHTTIRDADRRAVALHELTQRLESQAIRARAAQQTAPRPPQADTAAAATVRAPAPTEVARARATAARRPTTAARSRAEAQPAARPEARPGEDARVDLAPDRLRLAKSIECLR